ncbi:MAG: AAA family ATPase, partial [Rhodanobacteraceae bacterium]
AGFRGFPRPVELDLDADAIIVSGVNGSGKTSLFDALLWALSGAVPRLHQTDPAVVVSEYSPTGEARVEVVLSRDDEATVTVVRRFDDAMHLSVQQNTDAPVSGAAADAALIDLLWPDAKSAANQAVALTRSLTSATYLQQDVVRGFVDADDDQTRFAIVGELVGAGRIAEIQRQLESSKNVWTRATTGLTKEKAPLDEQRSAILDRLSRLRGASDVGDIEAQFQAWSESIDSLIGQTSTSLTKPTAEGLDRALAELSAQEQTQARRVAMLQRLANHLASPPPEAPDTAPLSEAVATTEARMGDVAERLAQAERQSAEIRRRQVEITEQAESLRTLAQLALRHLGERCPVCAQEYD